MEGRPLVMTRAAQLPGPVAAVAISLLSQNFGAAFAKSLFSVAGAEGIAALRVGFAALTLLAIVRPWRTAVDRARLRDLWVYGLVLGSMNLFIYGAFARIPIGVASAIEASGPLLVILLASRRMLDLLWLVLTAVGLSLLFPWQVSWAALDPLGVAFAACAGACWAMYIWFGKRVSSMPSGATVAWGMVAAAMLALPIGLFQSGSALLAPEVLLAGLAVAVFSSVLPYWLEMRALRNLAPHVFGILVSAAPAVGALAAFIVLGERLLPAHWVAISCIVAACAGAALTHAQHEG
jgi:inner membrane transporter RhtA